MGQESSDVFRLDLGPLLLGQTRITKVKKLSAYISLIIGPTGLGCEIMAGSLLIWSDLTLGTLFKVKQG